MPDQLPRGRDLRLLLKLLQESADSRVASFRKQFTRLIESNQSRSNSEKADCTLAICFRWTVNPRVFFQGLRFGPAKSVDIRIAGTQRLISNTMFYCDCHVPLFPSSFSIAMRVSSLFKPKTTVDDRLDLPRLDQFLEEKQIGFFLAGGFDP